MNSIKTSKFSVKGIDTTRYIPNEVRNLLSYVLSGGVSRRVSPPPRLVEWGSSHSLNWLRRVSPPPRLVEGEIEFWSLRHCRRVLGKNLHSG